MSHVPADPMIHDADMNQALERTMADPRASDEKH
jgi:hypothetical protein